MSSYGHALLTSFFFLFFLPPVWLSFAAQVIPTGPR